MGAQVLCFGKGLLVFRTFTLLIALGFFLLFHSPTYAALLFDNGAASTTSITWNMSGPFWGVVDEFSLSTDSLITDIIYEAWHVSNPTYSNTHYFISSSLPPGGNFFGGSVIASDSTSATIASNGLTSTGHHPNLPGFTHTLSNLSISLGAGTYYLGLRTTSNDDGIYAIGSGSGSIESIGPGLYQYLDGDPMIYTRNDNHMAFHIHGTPVTPVPLPSALLLFGSGLLIVKRYVWRKNLS